jgi:hypothetical protein
MPIVARLQPNRLGPVFPGYFSIFSCLTKLYYVLNKTKYINTLQAVARSGVAKRLKENENKQHNKK